MPPPFYRENYISLDSKMQGMRLLYSNCYILKCALPTGAHSPYQNEDKPHEVEKIQSQKPDHPGNWFHRKNWSAVDSHPPPSGNDCKGCQSISDNGSLGR